MQILLRLETCKKMLKFNYSTLVLNLFRIYFLLFHISQEYLSAYVYILKHNDTVSDSNTFFAGFSIFLLPSDTSSRTLNPIIVYTANEHAR